MGASENQNKSQKKSGYRKVLTLRTAVLLTVGGILGPAFAYIPASVLAAGGPAGNIAWIIAVLMIVPVALVYAELTSMFPKAGAVAFYPTKSHGPIVGALNGWAAFVGYTLAIPIVGVATVEYASVFYPSFYENGLMTPLGILVAALVAVLMFTVNTRKVEHLSTINNVLTYIRIASIIIIAGIFLVYFNPNNLTSYGGVLPYGSSGMFLAIPGVVFGYLGFRQAIDFSEEMKDPGKIVAKVVIITLLVVFALYIIISVAFLGVVNWSKFGIATGSWSSLSSLAYPLVSASDALGLASVGIFAVVVIIISNYGGGMVYYGSTSRVASTLATTDGYFPLSIGKLSKNGVPLNAALLVLVVSIIYIILLRSFYSVMTTFTDAIVFSYAPAAVSLAVFRKKYPAVKRPYLLPAYKILAPTAFVIGGLFIYFSGFFAIAVSMISVFVGLFTLFLVRKRRGITANDVKVGLWLPIYMLVVLAISYIGSIGGINYIHYPYDYILFIVVTLVFFYFGYYSGLKYEGEGLQIPEIPATN